MNIMTIEEKRFAGIMEGLYHDYDTVKTLYPYDQSLDEHWKNRVAWLDSHPGADPAQVSDALMALNQRLGAAEKTMNNIRTLSQKQCLVVVTGQQTGLFTGPLYTLYKAVTTIKRALSLSVETGRPVVPVFWMATEDHDYAEIAMNWHFNGSRVKRVRLSRTHKINAPVGNLPVTDELLRLCEELCAELGGGIHGQEMGQLLKQSLKESDTLGDWFGRLLLNLFAPWGLVVLDPGTVEMRRVMQPFLKKALVDTLAVQQAFQRGTQAVTALGFTPEVTMGEKQTGLFLIDGGDRTPLYADETGMAFSDRHERKHWTLEELLGRLETHPADFSTGVVLRPVVQDWLLPVAAAVLGPSEAAYHGQLGEVFTVFGRQLPVIVPRESWTLAPDSDFLDAGAIRALHENSPENWVSDRIMDLADIELRHRITQYHEDYLDRFSLLIDSLPICSDARKLLTGRAVEMEAREMKWMLKQIRKSLTAEAEEAVVYHSFARMMKPLGKIQERTLLPWYFLSHFGRDLLSSLIDMEFSMNLRIYTGGRTS